MNNLQNVMTPKYFLFRITMKWASGNNILVIYLPRYFGNIQSLLVMLSFVINQSLIITCQCDLHNHLIKSCCSFIHSMNTTIMNMKFECLYYTLENLVCTYSYKLLFCCIRSKYSVWYKYMWMLLYTRVLYK